MDAFLMTLATAAIAGVFLFRLRVPGGMMVGAILGACLLNVLTEQAFMPSAAKVMAQSLAGAFIATSVEREDLRRLPLIIRPACLLLTSVLILNLLLGYLIYITTPMDLMTALLCAVPGGMSDVPMIAADMGADAPQVALLQFVRMCAGIGVFPSLILWCTREKQANAGEQSVEDHAFASRRHSTGQKKQRSREMQQCSAGRKERIYQKRFFNHSRSCDLLLTLMIAGVCGAMGNFLGIPAGALVCSMVGVLVCKLGIGKAYLPLPAKRLAQVLSGAYVGSSITSADVQSLRYMLLPALLIISGYFLNSFLTGRLLHRLFGFPIRIGMLAATPAGATDMALISADLGVESPELIELQLIRLLTVVSVFPQIIWLLAA